MSQTSHTFNAECIADSVFRQNLSQAKNKTRALKQVTSSLFTIIRIRLITIKSSSNDEI